MIDPGSLAGKAAGPLSKWGMKKVSEHRQRRDPFLVSVEEHEREPWTLVMNAPLPQLPTRLAPPSARDVRRFLKSQGAVDYERTMVRCLLQSKGPRPVIIRDIGAEVIERRAPTSMSPSV